jgi:hypothetical protein
MAAFAGRADLAQANVAGDRGDVNAVGLWKDDGRQFLRATRFSDGAVQVSDGRALMREVAGMMAAPAPVVAGVVSRALMPAAQFAFDNWPVGRSPKKVRSKELVGLEYEVLGPGLWQASLVNRASYAADIRGGRTADALIIQNGRRAAQAASSRVGSAIVEVL